MRLVDVRRDGGVPGRGAVRAGGVRRARRCCSRCAYAVVRVGAHRAVPDRQPRRPGAAPLGHRAGGQHGDRRRAAGRGVVRRRRAAGRAVGARARCSTWRARSCSAPRAGSSSPGHFAERHGLIVIIALGRVDRRDRRRRGGAASTPASSPPRCSGVAVAAALWWLYFDVVALVAARRLENAAPGRERNEIARDSYSYLHFPMVAGIVLVALGLQEDARRTSSEPLELVPAVALLGGTALYLLAHVAFRWRNVHRFSAPAAGRARSCCLALIPVAHQIAALIGMALLAAAAARARRLRAGRVRGPARAADGPAGGALT